jgi:hypothetical protein
MSKTLLSDVSYVRLTLVESNGNRVKVRGEFAKCGVATENKRVYPKHVWEKEIKRLSKALKERRVFGEIDHPSDGQTKLARVSHVVTDLRIKDGIVEGEAEILPTEAGKNLMALLQSNVLVGVSSRGFGSVKTNDKNEDVVQDDYKLVTFDFVADPADVDAYPQVSESRRLFEGVEFDADEEQEKAIEWARRIEAEKTGRQVEAKETLREEFSRTLLSNLAALREEAKDAVRKEFLNDPEVGAAKQALESVKEILKPFILPGDVAAVVREKDAAIQKLQMETAELSLKLKTLEEENASLAAMAKEVGYRFYLERILSNDPQAESIRALVGDVTEFGSSDELKRKVESVRAELSRKSEETKKAVEAKSKEVESARAEESRLRAEFDKKLQLIEDRMVREQQKADELMAKLQKAEAEKQELESRLYAEERLKTHPNKNLKKLVESVRPTKSEIDDLVESNREPVRDADDLQQIRAKIRSRMSGGVERVPEEMQESVNPRRNDSKSSDYMGLGISLDSLRRLSGIGN